MVATPMMSQGQRVSPPHRGRNEQELHKDRVTAIVVMLVVAAVLGLILALASHGTLPTNGQPFDYWMMP